MRSLLFLAVLLPLLPIALVKPAIGAYLWAWLGIMNPHRLTYGFTMTLPMAQAVAIALLIGTVFTKDRKPIPSSAITWTLAIFVCWMTLTSPFALNPDKDAVWGAWLQMFKIHLMLFITLIVVHGENRIRNLIWVVVVSLGFFGVKGGIWTLLTGGSNRVWGPPGGIVEGNNELGVALVIVIPLMWFLAQTTKSKLTRRLLWASMAFCMAGVLGTHSRGAFLAVGAMGIFLGLRSGRPLVTSLISIALLTSFALFMPENWANRMRTIDPNSLDDSANSRLLTWQMIWNLALDRPVLGGGFAFNTEATYDRYLPDAVSIAFAPHSIYFQALGEHGFIGLALFLALGVFVWRTGSRLVSSAHGSPDLAWVGLLGRAVQTALVGYAVGGAFLSLLHFDVPYYIAIIAVAALREVDNHHTERTPARTGMLDPTVRTFG